ncbi:MAG: hypothetical protein WBD73_06380 [Candidatus Acidiferrales bacterium]
MTARAREYRFYARAAKLDLYDVQAKEQILPELSRMNGGFEVFIVAAITRTSMETRSLEPTGIFPSKAREQPHMETMQRVMVAGVAPQTWMADRKTVPMLRMNAIP